MLKVGVGGGGVVMVVTHVILRSIDKEEIHHKKWIIKTLRMSLTADIPATRPTPPPLPAHWSQPQCLAIVIFTIDAFVTNSPRHLFSQAV